MGIWLRYYKAKTGLKYRITYRSEKHLRNIRKSLIEQCDTPPMDGELLVMFGNFLLKIKSDWILENLDLSIIDSMFNRIWREQHKAEFPDYYSADFEKKLAGNEIMKYYQHLNKLGWKRIMNMGGYKWVKPTSI
jgi:hypothetical protein